MPRSFTVSKINALGDRLRHAAHPTESDLQMLQQVRLDYDPALYKVQQLLRSQLGLQVTSRLKTVGTIVDKLKRERTRLSRMQDIAGVRIVTDMTLTEQDAQVASIQGRFPGSEVIDRRERPSYGYRAVHVIVTVDGCPVEIQVRTQKQDRWAQILEKIADDWGRQIRYGGEPTDPEALVGQRSRREALEMIMNVSTLIAQNEILTEKHSALIAQGASVEELAPLVQTLSAQVDDLLARLLE
ncbi:MAG TPA: RelA/SpoT domain-containing protein [Myxococcota bacterium]|nr:RelA/SpoT domain-containing protein [Myxococcota bacterium]